MGLSLVITSYQRLSPGQTKSKSLEQGRLSIGRAPDNDWVLPDPEMVLSKNHCTIDSRDDGYYVTDTSTNGVFINHAEERVGRGNSVKINHQDIIILGDYEICAELSDSADSSEAAAKNEPIGSKWPADADFDDLLDSEPSPDSAKPSASDLDFDDIAPPSSIDDDDPLGLGSSGDDAEPDWGQYSEPDHLPAEREYIQLPNAISEPEKQPSSASKSSAPATPDPILDSLGLPTMPETDAQQEDNKEIPEDWEDSLIQRLMVPGEDAKQQISSETAAEPMSNDAEFSDPFAESDLPEQAAESDLPETAQPDPAQTTKPEEPAEISAPEQIDNLEPGNVTERIPVFKDIDEEAQQEPEPVPDTATSQPDVIQPDVAQPDMAQPNVAQPNVAQPGAAQSNQSNPLVQAFFQGAGMPDIELSPAEAQVMMHKLGQVFRSTSQGMMELLRARSSVKSEFHIERTMVGPMENNPLKILPNVDEAMHAMLLRKDKTWISSERAIKEGFDDLRAHEMAVIAGMEAALKHLLAAFDPMQLEQELGQHGSLSNILAGGRKARYWDAFNALYSKIALKAEDEFQELFRKEFSRAYQAQLEKLSQQR